MEIARTFPQVGGAAQVGRWPTRKYKKYRAYLLWLRRVEGWTGAPEEAVDDGKPSWEIVEGKDSPSWETESFKRPM